EESGSVALLADRGGLLGGGGRLEPTRNAAGNDVAGGHRLRPVDGGHEAVLDHSLACRHHHGRGGGTRILESLHDHPTRQANSGARGRIGRLFAGTEMVLRNGSKYT